MSKSKKQRSSIPTEEYECDRVSSLPDSILCQILSFLPTKGTVATRSSPRGGNHYGFQSSLLISPIIQTSRKQPLFAVMFTQSCYRATSHCQYDHSASNLVIELRNPRISQNLLLQQYKDELKPLNLTCCFILLT